MLLNSIMYALNQVGPLLQQAAAQRWLTPEEILILLVNDPAHVGLPQTFIPPPFPSSGQIYVYSEQAPYKNDGVPWARKKAVDRLQETYHIFKISGKDTFRGVYCKSSVNPNFRRRFYRLINKTTATSFVLVHYRESNDKEEKFERSSLHPIVAYFSNLFLSSISSAAPLPADHGAAAPAAAMDVSVPPSISYDDEIDFLGDFLDNMAEEDQQPLLDTSYSHAYATAQYTPPSSSSSFLPPIVLDYLPRTILEGVPESKCLIVLEAAVPAHTSWRKNCMLRVVSQQSYNLVALDWVADNVLRCNWPALHAGIWTAILVSAMNVPVFNNPLLTLEVKAIASAEPQAPGKGSLGKRTLSEPLTVATDTVSKVKDVADPLTLHMLDHDRQYKIRLVEKLGYMKSALEQDDASSFRRHLSKEHGSDDNVEWLDDTEVSKLSNAELESIMDKYIMTVVKQLVQLGSVDEDLRAEIDAVDTNGLSLLHYCCLYNLTSLIPVLVSRGADINQATNTGSSPLHLAVAAGHLLAAQVLLSNGANAHAVDGSGRGAVELARLTGNEEIHELLCRVCGSDGNVPYNAAQSPLLTPVKEQPKLDLNLDSFNFDESSDIDATTASMTAMLLQETFATLSLTDKCALSLTLGQIANNTASSEVPASATPQPSLHISKIRQTSVRNMDTIMENGVSVLLDICGDPLPQMPDSVRRQSFNAGEDMTDIQSVLSETDKESLDAAMSMMGHTELQQVEEEVRKIQNNVRGWLLRKNYTNLRDATKILQTAWRERKKTTHRPSPTSSRNDRAHEVPSPAFFSTTTSASSFSSPPSPPPSFANLNHNASMTPNSVHKSLASLVIQKNLVRWWTQSRTSMFHDLDRSNVSRTMTPNLYPQATAGHHVPESLEAKRLTGEFK